MSDYAEMADGPIEPAEPSKPVELATPEPPYIRYVKWEPPQTGPDLAHAEAANLRAEVAQLRAAVGDLPAVVKAMQESICHLELQVHRLLNQEGEL